VVARLSRALLPLASGLVALVLSHSLVYLARYGSTYGEALAHEGHDLAWTIAVWSIAILGASLAIAGLVRLVWLGRAAGRSRKASSAIAVDRAGAATGASLRGWLVAALRLAATTAVLLTLQENAEHLAAGLPLQGPLLLLRADYPFALAIVLAVSLAVSLVVALYRRRRDELLARLRGARAAFSGPRRIRRPVRDGLPVPASILGRIGGLRAPPTRLVS